ncbi:glutamate receptor 2.7-like [Magnolia sinica]|uniref:glutamate receptor 2.7-like n=1 Tax=Magnolia sinica TaxID=86752 RepID=UPI0026584737|nr:glutamate receptor 2.7-like [Magnolia sinica]
MAQNSTAVIDVGVVLDLEMWVGKMSQACISVALSDFYMARNHNTKLVLHMRDSKKDIVGAAAEVLDLLKNVGVKAIIGPTTSSQAEFVVDLGDKTQVPILSFSATSPSLNSIRTPYFVRIAQNDSSQVKAIAAIVKAFGWREVVPIYEDTDYGNGVIPFLTDAFQEIDAKVPYRSVIPPSATDDQILEELYKLMTMQTRVFVVHMFSSLASRFFSKVNDVGMMSDGYVWIITDGLTELLDSMDSSVIDSMQGVLGVKPYIPKSIELDNFTVRWKRKILLENPNITKPELSIFGLWAYDAVHALAMAVEQVGVMKSSFLKPETSQNSTDLANLGVSKMGPKLLDAILNTTFKGLSGEFSLFNGQMQSSSFQIINVVGKGGRGIGFWTPVSGLSRVLNKNTTNKIYSTTMDDIKFVIWPGESKDLPRGWVIPTSGKKLRIGVPVKDGFSEFVKVEGNPSNSLITATGFCIDVFDAVREQLPYALPYEFVPFENANGQSAGTYDDLIYQVFLQRLDAVVGDMTIVANRSKYVDFTLPYTDSGVSMVVPIRDDERKNTWIFLKPLSRNLWLTSGAGFVLTGFVVWLLEHRINKEFRGPPSHQIGMMFWFSFSTLVFAHKERVISNLSRFVVIIWVFVVLILTSSYTASLTSMLTVQQLQPTITDVKDLIKNGDYVGYQEGSFVLGLLKRLNFDESKLRVYYSPEDYAEALSKGSGNGGVAAIFDEIPYILLFLGRYCGLYTMVGPTYKTDGFGFAFPRGSPLVPDFSRAILNVTEGDTMLEIEQKWFGQQTACLDRSASQASVTSNNLTLDSFWGLFLIAGTASALAFFIFLVRFLHQNWHISPTPDEPITFRRWIYHLAKRFDEIDPSSHTAKKAAKLAAKTTAVPTTETTAKPMEGQVTVVEGIDRTSPNHTNAQQSPTTMSDVSDFNPRGGGTPSSEIGNNQGASTSVDMHNRNATGEITEITENKYLR